MATFKEARSVLGRWTLDSGVHPFGAADCLHPRDRTRNLLTQASAMLAVLSAASRDAQAITGSGGTSEFDILNIRTHGHALYGIGSLVDLANFLLEE